MTTPSIDSRSPILIVDDDVEIVETLTDLLGEEGLPAIGASSGGEAVAIARAFRPSLVLLDYRLGPADDGARVAERLRARWGDALPIVLLSGAADLASAARATGVVGTLAKPFSFEDLLQCIRRHRAHG